MLYYFRSSTILYFGLILAGLVFLPIFKVAGFGKDVFSFGKLDLFLYFLFILWIFISAYISSIYALRKLNILLKILFDKCDPHEYIETLENILRKKLIRNRSRTILLLNLSTGLLEAGKVDEAIQVLNGINKFSKSNFGRIQKMHYYNNLISGYLRKGDLHSASIALNSMKDILEDKKISKQIRNKYQKFLFHKQYLFNLEQGNYEGAEDFFKQMYENGESNLEKVSAKYALGQIYLNLRKFDEAREAFTYVVTHGNTLAKSKEAKNYLDRIV